MRIVRNALAVFVILMAPAFVLGCVITNGYWGHNYADAFVVTEHGELYMQGSHSGEVQTLRYEMLSKGQSSRILAQTLPLSNYIPNYCSTPDAYHHPPLGVRWSREGDSWHDALGYGSSGHGWFYLPDENVLAHYSSNRMDGKFGPDGYFPPDAKIRAFENAYPLARLRTDPWHIWILDSGAVYRITFDAHEIKQMYASTIASHPSQFSEWQIPPNGAPASWLAFVDSRLLEMVEMSDTPIVYRIQFPTALLDIQHLYASETADTIAIQLTDQVIFFNRRTGLPTLLRSYRPDNHSIKGKPEWLCIYSALEPAPLLYAAIMHTWCRKSGASPIDVILDMKISMLYDLFNLLLLGHIAGGLLLHILGRWRVKKGFEVNIPFWRCIGLLIGIPAALLFWNFVLTSEQLKNDK